LYLYADQLAWLNSKSKGSKKARKDTLAYDMPDISYCSYIATMAIDYGLKPEWSELNAWNILTGASLNKFESKAVHLMSTTYQFKHSEYSNTDLPRPFAGNSRQSSDSIKSALRKK
jgi:hypothetical protein